MRRGIAGNRPAYDNGSRVSRPERRPTPRGRRAATLQGEASPCRGSSDRCRGKPDRAAVPLGPTGRAVCSSLPYARPAGGFYGISSIPSAAHGSGCTPGPGARPWSHVSVAIAPDGAYPAYGRNGRTIPYGNSGIGRGSVSRPPDGGPGSTLADGANPGRGSSGSIGARGTARTGPDRGLRRGCGSPPNRTDAAGANHGSGRSRRWHDRFGRPTDPSGLRDHEPAAILVDAARLGDSGGGSPDSRLAAGQAVHARGPPGSACPYDSVDISNAPAASGGRDRKGPRKAWRGGLRSHSGNPNIHWLPYRELPAKAAGDRLRRSLPALDSGPWPRPATAFPRNPRYARPGRTAPDRSSFPPSDTGPRSPPSRPRGAGLAPAFPVVAGRFGPAAEPSPSISSRQPISSASRPGSSRSFPHGSSCSRLLPPAG